MKVGYFSSVEGWGGSETYLKALIIGVRDRGHDVVFFGVNGTRLFRELSGLGIQCIAWKNILIPKPDRVDEQESVSDSSCLDKKTERRLASVKSLFPVWVKLLMGNIKEALHLYKLFTSDKVDVMHVAVHGYEVAGIACRFAGIPSVAMNMITPPTQRYWFRRWLMKMTAGTYSVLSSQSAYCTGVWQEFAGLKQEHCTHVWSSVDLEKYPIERISQRDWASTPFRLISLGRLHHMKGYSYLIQAMSMLKDEDVMLEILGDGYQRNELEALIKCNGIEDKVSLLGYVENVEAHLFAAHCFVLPSVSLESCPAVLSEAMAAGLPLITSDFGPLAEVNINGKTGLVVPMHSVDKLKDSILTLLNDPKMCQDMGKCGRMRAEVDFSREKMIDKTIGVYNFVTTE